MHNIFWELTINSKYNHSGIIKIFYVQYIWQMSTFFCLGNVCIRMTSQTPIISAIFMILRHFRNYFVYISSVCWFFSRIEYKIWKLRFAYDSLVFLRDRGRSHALCIASKIVLLIVERVLINKPLAHSILEEFGFVKTFQNYGICKVTVFVGSLRIYKRNKLLVLCNNFRAENFNS